MDKFSYGLGLGIGQHLLSMGAEVNVDDFARLSVMYWKVKDCTQLC